MSGGGSSAPAPAPSTTTTVQDVPAWEQGYLTNLLGQAQTIAAQPYQQYPGQQVAAFTPNQQQAFSNIQNLGGTYQPTQTAGANSAAAGANTAGNIYNAGAPYAQAASMAASPQGISAFMSPYTNSVVQGLTNQANMNWNQNIMPSVNDAFIGSGQFGSGRNAQVLGQAANNFQTNLNSSIANVLESGYNTAGNQAATQANTLLNTGSTLGNLAATQGQEQANAGTALSNIGTQQLQNNLTNAQALQAVGQQQQQQNQNNLNVAQQNWQNQVSWPMQQTEYLSGIIRGLPAMGSASTSASQVTPQGIYTPSPLSGIGGSGVGALSLLGSSGQQVGTVSAKTGGLIKGYADGGEVEGDDSDDDILSKIVSGDLLPNGQPDNAPTPPSVAAKNTQDYLTTLTGGDASPAPAGKASFMPGASASPPGGGSNPLAALALPKAPQLDDAQIQRAQLLAIARGMLSPTRTGSPWESLGNAIGGAQDTGLDAQKWNAEQQMKMVGPEIEAARLGQTGQYQQQELGIRQKELDQQQKMQEAELGLKQQQLEQGKYTVTPDQLGGFLKINNKTGDVEKIPAPGSAGIPSIDPKTGQPVTGEEYLKTLPPDRAAQIKALDEGRLNFPTGFALKSPYWQQMLSQLYQYNPDASAQSAAALRAFNTGKQGDTTRSLSVTVEHFDTLGKLLDAMDNGDTKAINAVSNAFKDQFGKTAPNNFNTAKQIVGDEVVKAVVGAGGSQADREKAQAVISAANSPAQLKGAIQTYQTLMKGQLAGLQNQYEVSTGRKDFMNRLTPHARTILSSDQQAAPSATSGHQPSQIDIDYLKKNPNLAAKFEAKFGAGGARQYLGGQ